MIEHIEHGRLPPGRKACIALTSWKKRINTVGLTIFNLMCVCGPEFHIVLTLAEEEFPRKERELPRDLQLMNRAGLFEILWCKKNVKPFKKWLYCALRYTNTPIISADDDCLYTCNYADLLMQLYEKTNAPVCTCSTCSYEDIIFSCGAATLYKFSRNELLYAYSKLTPSVVKLLHDDIFWGIINKVLRHQIAELGCKYTDLCRCCLEIDPLSAKYDGIIPTIHKMLPLIIAN